MPSPGIEMRLLNLPEVLAALARQPARLRRAAKQGLIDGAVRVQRTARKNAPHFEGGFERTIAYEVVDDGQAIIARVGTNMTYRWQGREWDARVIELGSRPHLAPIGLTDYGKRWLKAHGFVDAQGDTPDFIPVSGKAHPFLLPAFKAEQHNVMEDVANALRAEVARG